MDFIYIRDICGVFENMEVNLIENLVIFLKSGFVFIEFCGTIFVV